MGASDLKETNLSLYGSEKFNIGNARKLNSHSIKNTFKTEDLYSRFVALLLQTSGVSKLSDFDSTVSTHFNSLILYGKEGIPLAYPRKKFVENLNELLLSMKSDEREKIQRILKISLVKHGYFNGSIGYNGILDIAGLNLKDDNEKAIYEECLKFLFQNEVITGNDKLDNILNTIIKGMPEFINLIGKRQHRSHNYSVDIHSLEVMQNIVTHPEYIKLSNDDKFVLKMTALLHDIGKPEGVPDKNHPFISYKISKSFIKRYNLSSIENDRLLKSVKNHQWLQWYNMSMAGEEIINSLVDDYKKQSDYKMALIMASADLKATSDYINDCYSHLLGTNYQIPMQRAVDKKFAINKNDFNQVS